MKFEGIYTPVLTPYDDNHAINFDAIEPIIEDLISSGVHGIVVAGTTGEYYAQDTKERLQVMKISKDIINNRVPCIVGTGAIRTEDSVFYAEDFINSMPDSEQFRNSIGSIHPVNRTGKTEEVASLVAWLASTESSFVTGQVYTIDGGRMAKISLPTL